MNNMIKNIFITFFLILTIVLLCFIICYDKIATKNIKEVTNYAMSDKMQNDIKEEGLEDIDEVITTYNIDASDLKKYEKSGEYDKGKVNPFATVSDDVDENIINTNGYYGNNGTK